MHWILETIAIALLLCILHLSMMALTGTLFGIKLLEFKLGFGPRLFSGGAFRIHLFPLGGEVRFKNATDEDADYETLDDAMDRQPAWKQFFVLFSGIAAVFGVAIVGLGAAAWPSFLATFEQFARGAMGPFTTAQAYLESYRSFAIQQGFVATAGLLAAKMTSVNLLSNGSYLLRITTSAVPALGGLAEKAMVLVTLVGMMLAIPWLIADVVFIWRHL